MSLNIKYLRSLLINYNSNGTQAMMSMFKLAYEFWGFCVNGDNDLIIPGTGSFATTSSINMPVGFVTGSLLASGSDGSTELHGDIFTSPSAYFSSSYVFKYLTLWKSGSSSSDDSIYLITDVLTTSSIRVDVTSGGSPDPTYFNRPKFTSRSNINYRLFNLQNDSLLTLSSGSNLVMQFPGANEVNVNQLTPQVKITWNGTRCGFWISPSGTWNGTNFSDGNEYIPNSWGITSSPSSKGHITMIGAPDFHITFANAKNISYPDTINGVLYSWSTNNGFGWHIEIPQRIYPQVNDPNPVVAIAYSNGMVLDYSTDGYLQPYMIGISGTMVPWKTAVKNHANGGTGWDAIQYSNDSFSEMNTMYETTYNRFKNTVKLADCVLSNTAAGQYSLMRCRLRRMRVMYQSNVGSPNPSNTSFQYQAVNDVNGMSWIKIQNTFCWPWDGVFLDRPFLLYNGV